MMDDTRNIERVRGQYIGRNRSSAYKDLVFTVATAANIETDIISQTEQALVTIENNLSELGSHKHRILSAQVYLANILDKPKMDAVWCQWIGSNPQHWPQRVCIGVALEGNMLIEIAVTAVR
jgi:enamine deaminase RidA (YjgF/YER057c/UK114 family)